MSEKIISASAYRDDINKAQEVTLPSGATFLLKKLTPFDYLTNGLDDIPSDLLTYLDTEDSSEDTAKKVLERKDSVKLLDQIIRIVVEKGIVAPKVSLTYSKEISLDDTLLFTELSSDDQQAIFKYVVHGDLGKKE